MRRDKAKTCEYRRRITVEQLAAAQARLRDLDLAARKQKESEGKSSWAWSRNGPKGR